VTTTASGGAPLLLDTAAFIFWHADSPRLPASVRAVLLQSMTREIHVSAVSAFEIATKVRLGKLNVPSALLTDFQYVVEADGFRMLELDAQAAVRAGLLGSPHRDPFDRLIAAQALTRELTVATLDGVFAEQFGVPVFW
jgi:PIN domain nuclease of toxin-antitoxin system